MRKKSGIILLVMFLLGTGFLIFGHIAIVHEEIRAVQENVILGEAIVVPKKHSAVFRFQSGNYEIEIPEERIGNFEQLQNGDCVIVSADLESGYRHSEKRTIITGRLQSEEETEFYRPIRVYWQESDGIWTDGWDVNQLAFMEP